MALITAFTDPGFWLRLLGIGVLNLLLSGDNALVIALTVRALPRRQRWLSQIWGALGAIALRLVFVAIVGALLRIPFLQFAGGLLLVWIAIRLVKPPDEPAGTVRQGVSLWEAIWIIIVADVTMSLDNVLAIVAAARGDFLLVVFGVGLSLPLVIWGAELLARLMNRYVWIVWLGGGLLGYVAAEMGLDDPVLRGWLGAHAAALHHSVPIVVAAIVTALGWRLSRGKRQRIAEKSAGIPRRM
jgi:YjbE family integral membrane protein